MSISLPFGHCTPSCPPAPHSSCLHCNVSCYPWGLNPGKHPQEEGISGATPRGPPQGYKVLSLAAVDPSVGYGKSYGHTDLQVLATGPPAASQTQVPPMVHEDQARPLRARLSYVLKPRTTHGNETI